MRAIVQRGAFLAALVLAPQPASAQDDFQIGIARGAVPPAVTIEDLDGDPVDLGRFIGRRPAVFEFWATWCPLCAELFPRLEAAHATYGDRVDFVVIAVGVNQSPRTIRRHLARHPMPFTVLWDGRGRATRAFEAPTTSYVVVLDADGKVVYTGTGGDQDIGGVLHGLVGVSGERGQTQ